MSDNVNQTRDELVNSIRWYYNNVENFAPVTMFELKTDDFDRIQLAYDIETMEYMMNQCVDIIELMGKLIKELEARDDLLAMAPTKAP